MSDHQQHQQGSRQPQAQQEQQQEHPPAHTHFSEIEPAPVPDNDHNNMSSINTHDVAAHVNVSVNGNIHHSHGHAQQQTQHYIAVRKGDRIRNCIFHSWDDVKHHLTGPNSHYSIFESIHDAVKFAFDSHDDGNGVGIGVSVGGGTTSDVQCGDEGEAQHQHLDAIDDNVEEEGLHTHTHTHEHNDGEESRNVEVDMNDYHHHSNLHENDHHHHHHQDQDEEEDLNERILESMTAENLMEQILPSSSNLLRMTPGVHDDFISLAHDAAAAMGREEHAHLGLTDTDQVPHSHTSHTHTHTTHPHIHPHDTHGTEVVPVVDMGVHVRTNNAVMNNMNIDHDDDGQEPQEMNNATDHHNPCSVDEDVGAMNVGVLPNVPLQIDDPPPLSQPRQQQQHQQQPLDQSDLNISRNTTNSTTETTSTTTIRRKRGVKRKYNQTKARHKLTNNRKENEWNTKYNLLSQHVSTHGSCTIPKNTTNPDHALLSTWIQTQKIEIRKLQQTGSSKLTAAQVQKLHDVGLKFTAKRPYYSWDERLEQLKQFKAAKGHARVPVNHPDLGSWVHDQRRQYKLYIQSDPRTKMTREKLQKMIDVGFVFEVAKKSQPYDSRSNAKTWEDRFEELKDFKETFGHTIVPQHYPNLGWWVNTQRKERKKLKAGKKTSLTIERCLKLTEIGFVFDASHKRTSSTNYTHAAYEQDVNRDDGVEGVQRMV